MLTDLDPFTAAPAELLSAVADMEPGPLALSVLLMIDPSALGPDDAVAFLQVHERISSWWASVQTRALVAAAGVSARVDEFWVQVTGTEEERRIRIEDAAREEVGSAVRWAPSTTQMRIDTARLLAGPLAATWQALALGDITPGHVAVIAEAARRFDGMWAEDGPDRDAFWAACARLQDRLLPVARTGTLAATRAAAKRAVTVIDAEGARRRRAAARCTRSVHVYDELDGISVLVARMSTVDAHAVMAAVEGRSGHVAEASVGECRSVALADLVLGRAPSASAPGGGDAGGDAGSPGVTVRLDVVVDARTLLGLADYPVTLRGAGDLSADEFRDLLAALDEDSAVAVRRILADDTTGHAIDVGRTRYVPTEALRALIHVRDVTCRFPGCRRRADGCQIDHAVGWDDGGATSRDNVGALCTRHHQLKTHAAWRITGSNADGSCTWTSPHGRAYHHTAIDIRGST